MVVAAVMGALALGGAATAQADTVYPVNANSFSGDQQNWVDTTHTCGLSLGPLDLPLGAISPLVCTVTNSYSAGTGNPPGSLQVNYKAAAGLLGLIRGTSEWTSPAFTITGAPTGAVFSLDRRPDITGLINIGGQAAYTVTLRDVTAGKDFSIGGETLTQSSPIFTKVANNNPVPASALVAGHSYTLKITTTLTTQFLQAALNDVNVYYDNVSLKVADGNGVDTTGIDLTAGSASNVTETSATLNGIVNTHGVVGYAGFELTNLTANPDVITTTPVQNAGTANAPVTKAEVVTGLTACTTYKYRLYGANVVDTRLPTQTDPATDRTKDKFSGFSGEFSTNCAPDAQVLAASPVGQNTATLNGRIDSRGEDTTYHFEYGPAGTFTARTPDRVLPGSRNGAGVVSEPLTGLTAATNYSVKLVATNRIKPDPTPTTTTFTTLTPPADGTNGTNGANGANGTNGTNGSQGPTGPKGATGSVNPTSIVLANGDSRALLVIRSRVARIGLVGRRRGQIRLPIFCNQASGRSCAGTVKIRTIGKINPSSRPGIKKTPRRVTLATFSYQLAAGKRGFAIAQSNIEKLNLMERVKKVKVLISVQVSDAAGNRQTITQRGTFVAQRTV